MLSLIKIIDNPKLEKLLNLLNTPETSIKFSTRDPTDSLYDITHKILFNYKTNQILIPYNGKLYNINTGETIDLNLNTFFGFISGLLPLIDNNINEFFGKLNTSVYCGSVSFEQKETKVSVAYFNRSTVIQVNYGYKLPVPFGYTGLVYPMTSGLLIGVDYAGAPGGSEFDYHIGLSNYFGNNVGAYGHENYNYCINAPFNQWYYFVSLFSADGIKFMLFDKDNFQKVGECNRSLSLSNSFSTKVGFGGLVYDVNYSGCGAFFQGYGAYFTLLQTELNLDLINMHYLYTRSILF